MKTIALLAVSVVAGYGGEKPGEAAFQRRCAGCHDLNRDKAGPRLGEVFGRKAGSATGFEYSDALKKSGIMWDEATLDKWIADPANLVPENDMPFRLEDAKEREAIIQYLKEAAKRK